MHNTLAQDLASEQWTKCDRFPDVRMDRIDSEGRIWVKYWSEAEFRDWSACVNTVRAEQGRRTAAVTPAATGAPATSTVTAAPASIAPPIWRVGDEWAYRWENSRGAGTFVWSVDREEGVDGVAYTLGHGVPHGRVPSGAPRSDAGCARSVVPAGTSRSIIQTDTGHSVPRATSCSRPWSYPPRLLTEAEMCPQ